MNMKRIFGLLSLAIIILVSVSACHGLDPKPMHPELYEAQQQLMKRYGKVVVGEWSFEHTSEKEIIKETLKLNADSTFSGHVYEAHRGSVVKGGETIYGDWEVEVDSDIKNTSSTGEPLKWTFYVTEEANYLSLSGARYTLKKWPEYGSRINGLKFVEADDKQLAMQEMLYNRLVKFERIR